MKKYILLIFLFSSLAEAQFTSFDNLRSQLGEVGYPVVLRVSPGDFGVNLYTTEHSGHAMSINDFIGQNVQRKVRIPSFDFVESDGGPVTHEAYRVADVLVCYFELTRWRLARRRIFESNNPGQVHRLEENFDYCLIIPASIEEVERALLRRRPVLNEESTTTDDGVAH